MLLISGNAHRALAEELAASTQIPLIDAQVTQFNDGETKVHVPLQVRNKSVFIIQPTCFPVNQNIFELCLLVNALRLAKAKRVIAVVPYFGYARQDYAAAKRGDPLSAQVVANMLGAAGIDHLITVDLHSPRISDFFTVPVDNLSCTNMFHADILAKQLHNPVIVAPDIGSVQRTKAIAKLLHAEFALIEKKQQQNIIGNVANRPCVIIDDMVDSATTLCSTTALLHAQGAHSIYAYCTHAVLSLDALQRVEQSACIELVISNSIPLKENAMPHTKLRQISIAPILKAKIFAIVKNPH